MIKSEVQNCIKYIIDATDEEFSERYIIVYPLNADYIK